MYTYSLHTHSNNTHKNAGYNQSYILLLTAPLIVDTSTSTPKLGHTFQVSSGLDARGFRSFNTPGPSQFHLDIILLSNPDHNDSNDDRVQA